MTRGPTEPAPFPPADLASRPLPLVRWESGATVVRVHRAAHGPIHFSPGPDKPPLGRFDSASGRFGVLYAAQAFEGAFVETLIRNPARALISLAEIEARALSIVAIHEEMLLVDLTGPGLSRLGLDARFLSGPYDPCGAWADALHDHPSQPAGIAYPSRFDPSQLCVALFSRLAPHLEPVTEPVPLNEMRSDVALILDRYGKALDPG
ncbi:RES family NAD+ phosphorylase [Paracraurococcus lichenis]|uniref:RES family NAD+ phosphorylase n=1 Tax=Paracraurococcus lichenis TaxID=3064888 RepID=A0ABT9EBW9_9PROT|nr:RES family NAD+ phosphorylase [Paracraurococcus sp. LOR1-02]MDO9713706.1 RES family NAD+ phosphorylase [Paracraurococcus sp. LOR1-02]